MKINFETKIIIFVCLSVVVIGLSFIFIRNKEATITCPNNFFIINSENSDINTSYLVKPIKLKDEFKYNGYCRLDDGIEISPIIYLFYI